MKDELGAPFKDRERNFRTFVSGETFCVIRLDGKNFSSWTRNWQKPFDGNIAEAMVRAMQLTTMSVQDAICGYTQSDECSIILRPMTGEGSERWFGGQVQKIATICASMFTYWFNHTIENRVPVLDVRHAPAFFDARVTTCDDVSTASNYLAWRQNDARRNAVSMMCHKHIGERAVRGKGTAERRAILQDAGYDPDSVDQRFINGSLFYSNSEWIPEIEAERAEWITQLDAGKIRNWFYFRYLDIDVARGIVSEEEAIEVRRLYDSQGATT